MVPELLLKTVLEEYSLAWEGVHGVSHWARVLENGRRLAPQTGANLEVVELFAVLHDSKRKNDGIDFLHGPEGAVNAAKLRGFAFELDDANFELLRHACADHTRGFTRADVTVQTCWDADRLDLNRVGILPRQKLLCTQPARDPALLGWANERASARAIPDLVLSEWGIDLNRIGK